MSQVIATETVVFLTHKVIFSFSAKDLVPWALRSRVCSFTLHGQAVMLVTNSGETNRHFSKRVRKHLSTEKNSTPTPQFNTFGIRTPRGLHNIVLYEESPPRRSKHPFHIPREKLNPFLIPQG